MAFDDFCVNSGLTNLALALVYDWRGPHLVSIADVKDVIYLRTLSSVFDHLSAYCDPDHWSSRRDPHRRVLRVGGQC